MLIMVMPARSGSNQMIGRHLRHARRRRAGRDRLAKAGIAGDHVARLDKRVIAWITVLHARAADAGKRIDVELIVGEDHEVLEMLGIGPGVVIEPVQGIIDARGTKQGEWRGRARSGDVRAIGNRIVHGAKIGDVEHSRAAAASDAAVSRGAALASLLMSRR